MSRRLVLNRIRTPDGTVLTSKHVHDYVSYIDENGETYMLDGGMHYQRTSVNKEPYEDLSVYSDDTHENIREGFYWGTRGKYGDQPLTYKPLKDLDTDHIEAILDTQKQLPEWNRSVFKAELVYRGIK